MIWKATLSRSRSRHFRVPLVMSIAVLVAVSAASCFFPSPNVGTARNVLTSASSGASEGVIAVGWAASGTDRSPIAMHRTSSSWQLERVPAPARADTVLNAVSVLGDTKQGDTAWAVGRSDPDGSTPAKTFVAYRAADGSWQMVSSSNPSGANVLNAVFAGYPTMCEEICYITVMAAGTTVTSDGAKHPLIMRMRYPVGQRPPTNPAWSFVTPDPKVLPAPACGDPAGKNIELFTVTGFQDPEHPLMLSGRRGTCPLALMFFVNGWTDNSPAGAGVIYAQGSGWSVGADNLLISGNGRSPVVGLHGRYVEWRAITARSRPDGSVWVAGRASRTASRSGPFDPVLARWDGRSWQLAPMQPLKDGGAFYGIALTPQNALWSVGTSGQNRYTLTDGR